MIKIKTYFYLKNKIQILLFQDAPADLGEDDSQNNNVYDRSTREDKTGWHIRKLHDDSPAHNDVDKKELQNKTFAEQFCTQTTQANNIDSDKCFNGEPENEDEGSFRPRTANQCSKQPQPAISHSQQNGVLQQQNNQVNTCSNNRFFLLYMLL